MSGRRRGPIGTASFLCSGASSHLKLINYFVSSFAQPTPTNDRDEYDDWLARSGHPEDVQCTDPIAYWQAWVKETLYPRLARMALDLMTIPPMSLDPERIFSLTGLLLTANRARLPSDTIGASMAVGSWNKEGVIDMVDGQSKRPQKEGKVRMRRKVSQYHA